jgi:uncharacterized protein (TIGR04222 family)
VALLAGLALVGCTTRTPLNPLNWYGSEFLGLFWALCLTLLPLAWWQRTRASQPHDDYLGPAPGTYELARLADHGRRVADCALAALVHTGKAELEPGRRIKRTAAEPPTEPYERAVWNLIIAAGWSDLDDLKAQALGPNIGALRALDEALEAKGLVLPAEERRRIDNLPLYTALGLALFGFAKVLVGVNRDRPVGFLLLSLLALGVGVWNYRRAYGTWATGRGTRLLRDAEPGVRQAQRTEPLSGRLVALSVALFGVEELNALGLSFMAIYLLPPPRDRSGDGSSGCGGGGDGGGDGGGSGCGGCGGCGGGD